MGVWWNIRDFLPPPSHSSIPPILSSTQGSAEAFSRSEHWLGNSYIPVLSKAWAPMFRQLRASPAFLFPDKGGSLLPRSWARPWTSWGFRKGDSSAPGAGWRNGMIYPRKQVVLEGPIDAAIWTWLFLVQDVYWLDPGRKWHPQTGSSGENWADVPSAKGRAGRREILRDTAVPSALGWRWAGREGGRPGEVGVEQPAWARGRELGTQGY